MTEFIDDILQYPASGRGLFGVVLRSPVACGLLTGIETPPLPGKVTLIRAGDIPGENRLEGPGGHIPVLAEKELSYIGEPAAILAGPDKSVLLEFAPECRILAEEQYPVFDPAVSKKTAAVRRFSTGGVERAFEQAETIIEGSYTTGFQEAWTTDPNGAIAIPRMNKAEANTSARQKPKHPVTGMIVRTASQWPFHVAGAVARVLGIDPGMVEFRPARLEFHFDGKLMYPSLCSCHAALAAWITSRPVKLVLGRTEDFRFSPKRVRTEITLRSAVGKDGCILGSELAVSADMGASPFFAEEILDHTVLGAFGAYRHGGAAVNARAALTNVPPAGPLAGFGLAAGFFAAERHASRIADELREDPAEWRKNVFFHKGSRLAIGSEIRDQVNLDGLLDAAASMSDYKRKWASFEMLRQHHRAEGFGAGGEPLRGIGIAAAFQGNGLLYPPEGRQGVEITLEKDGSLEIRTSMLFSGEDHLYPWKIIASRELGVGEELVRIVTEGKRIPDSGPDCLSRNITLITRLVERACQAVKKTRFRSPLPITVRRFYTPSKSAAWGSSSVSSVYDENSLSPLSWAAAVVQAEIDPVEYLPKVRGVWLAVDGGPILSENRARKSLTQLSIQALNLASRESVHYENGIISEALIREYPLFPLEEIPPITIDFQWSDGTPRGIGELPFSTIPAAYVQALSQAMDHHWTKIPVGSADIWRLVKSRENREHAK